MQFINCNRDLVLEPTDETFGQIANQAEETRFTRRAPIIRSQSYIDEGRNHRHSNAKQPQRQQQRHSGTSIFSQLIHLQRSSARDIVLRYCRQTCPQPFDEVYASANALRNCRKIGEGVYSEVFMYKHEQTGRPVVLKIIPIEGRQCVNGEPQKRFDEILSEIAINSNLANLRYGRDYKTTNFVELLQVHCCQGKYPEHFVDLWELYRDNFGTLNDHPEIFDDEQLFIVLELANGGQDLESFQFQNAQQTYSAFLQVAISLAVAEKTFEFEHRDLHWGNILLTKTEETSITYTFDGEQVTIPTHGVRVTIIDFTLSRMLTQTGRCYFNDLSHQNEFFDASGDYQFDIYRLMRDRIKNCWNQHEPYTNLLWLHYVIDKCVHGVRYSSTKTKKHRTSIDRLMQIRDNLLEYRSVIDFVQAFRDSYYAAGHV